MITLLHTKDQSPTLYSSQFDQTYHSIHGAIAESQHVFIEHGLGLISDKTKISIFEMGYGTGINAMLSLLYGRTKRISIHYESIEKFPVPLEVWEQIKFEEDEMTQCLNALNGLSWNVAHRIEGFTIHKMETDIMEYLPEKMFDLIYFDAFSPNSQPELWTSTVFDKMYSMMNSGGILSTYCAKGEVKRTLKSSGFRVESRPGPVGKREMTIAFKI